MRSELKESNTLVLRLNGELRAGYRTGPEFVARWDALAYCRRRMRRLFYAALALIACLSLPSCSLIGAGLRKIPWKKKKAPADSKDNNFTQVIGVVEMVNPEQKFVLIRTQTRMTISAGQELSAMDGFGGFARLKVTPEKKQDFLTADIVDGNPRAGNVVMFKPNMKTVPPATPNQPPGPNSPPFSPPPELPVQPMPLTPVSPSEFTRPGAATVPATPSPIPPQPVPAPNSGANVPEPGQIQLPPIVR